jgi:hypothetical protein
VHRDVLDWLKSNRSMMAVAVGALVIGLGTGYWLSRSPGSSDGKPEQPIEWTAMQAVPTRTPDVEDNEWQQRSNALDAAENRAEARANNNVASENAG